MKIYINIGFFILLSLQLESQDNTNWAQQLENIDVADSNRFRTKSVFVDQDSNYYLFGKAQRVAYRNDTLQIPQDRLIRHYISKFSNSGEHIWLKDEKLLWQRSWLALDSSDNFHCIKQRPSNTDSGYTQGDIIYNKLDHNWNLTDSIELVKMESNVGSAYMLSFDIVDNYLYMAFSAGSSTDSYIEIDNQKYSVQLDSQKREYMFLVKYDLEEKEISWLKRFSSDSFPNFHVKSNKNGDVYLVTNYLEFITLDDEDIQFTSNNCRNCSEMLIAMFDSSGNIKWRKQIEMGANKNVQAIYEDDGNLYIAGQFAGIDVRFGDFLISGQSSVFILKIDQEGVFTHAKSLSFSAAQNVSAIEKTEEGHIILAGSYVGEGQSESGDSLRSYSPRSDNAYVYYLNEDLESIKAIGIYGEQSQNYISDILWTEGKIAIAGFFSNKSSIIDTTLTQVNFEFGNVHNGYLALVDIEIDDNMTVNTDDVFNVNTDHDYFRIVPNPSSGIFEIDCDTEEIVRLTIYNSDGMLVKIKENWNTRLDSILLRDNGLYYVTIENDNVKQQSIVVISQ